MKQPIKISICTQVYNTKPYLRQCIDSVLNQTYSNFEYFIIDNGCTDGSTDILREYSERDSRIQLIRFEKNEPFPRWLDIVRKHGTGKYIADLDSDDWLESDFLEQAVAFVEKNNLDIACTTSYSHDEISGKAQIYPQKVLQPVIINRDEFSSSFSTYFSFFVVNWAKLIRTSLVRSVTTEPQTFGYGDDTLWNFQWIRQSNRIGIFHTPLHHFRIHGNSISSQYNPKRFDSCVYLFKDLTEFLNDLGTSLPENQERIEYHYLFNVQLVLETIKNASLPLTEKLREYHRVLEHPLTQKLFYQRTGRRAIISAINSVKPAIISNLLHIIKGGTLSTLSKEEFQTAEENLRASMQILLPRCYAGVNLKNATLFLEDHSLIRSLIGEKRLYQFYVDHHRTFLLLFGTCSPLRFFPGNAIPLLQSLTLDSSEAVLERLRRLARNRRLAERYALAEAIQELEKSQGKRGD